MKKISAAFLALIMLISVFAFSACFNSPETTDTGKTASSATGTSTGAQTSGTDDPDKWPEYKFENGTTLYILGRDFCKEDFTSPGIIEEAVNDAVYERNEWLKENYNFDVEINVAANDNEWLTIARSASQAGDSYDLFVGSGKNMSTIAQGNLLSDMSKIESVNLDAEWWDANATHDLSIAGRVFITSGAIQTSDIKTAYCIFMNKNLLEESQITDDPYQLAREGKWTVEKMYNIIKDQYVDLNDNGTADYDDKFGYVCEKYDSYALYFCSGERIVEKDEDDLPTLTVWSSRTTDFLQVMKSFYQNKAVLVDYAKNILPISTDRRALFCGSLINSINLYMAMDDDFGILPMPMYEENQERYSHTLSVCTTGSLIGIPTCSNDIELTGLKVELLARKSLTTLRPAYLDATVTNRGLRDEDSLEMLNIIVGSRVYDVAYMNMWGPKSSPAGDYGWMHYFYWISANPDNADMFASVYDSSKESTEQEIRDTIDAYFSHLE